MPNAARRVILALAAIALGAALTPRAGATLDPQDGPHAEVRITITDTDVRFNVAMNLNYVDAIAPTQREFSDIVDPVEEPRIREAIENFFLEQNTVTIDGVEVRGIIEEYELIRLPRENLKLFPKTGLRALTRFSVVVSYPFKSEPEIVTMRWSAYPEDTLSTEPPGPDGSRPKMIILALLKAEGIIEQIVFSEEAPVVEWRPSHATIDDRLEAVPEPEPFPVRTIPALSIGFIGAWILFSIVLAPKKGLRVIPIFGLPLLAMAFVARDTARVPISEPEVNKEALLDVFRPLHTNVYRAFDYSAEEDIYDALSRSVSGPMLEELYTSIHRSLVQAEQGGAVGRITKVLLDEAEVVDVDPDAPQFTVEAYWLVEGTVYHWGHSHPRQTIYHARYDIAGVEGSWKIVGSEVLSSRHRDPTPFLPEDGPAL